MIYVDANVPDGNGTSWADAYQYLQDGLVAANSLSPPVEIRVAKGTYKPDQGGGQPPGGRSCSFGLLNGVAIYGGYAGSHGPDPNVRDIALYETILSGDLDGNDVPVSDPAHLDLDPSRSENSFHVVRADGTDQTSVLDGVTIEAGNATGVWSVNRYAAGIVNIGGDFQLANCTLRANAVPGDGVGGAMSNETDANPTILNCTFTRNWAGGGGALANAGASPTVIGCTFSHNKAGGGAAVYNLVASPTLINCVFIGNIAEGGGGMTNQQSSPTMINCIFSGNAATLSYGGAVSNISGGTTTLVNCTLSGNFAQAYGGAIYCGHLGHTTTLSNSIAWGNTVAQEPYYGIDIYIGTMGTLQVDYSDVGFISNLGGTYIAGPNIAADPNFVRDPNDGGDGWGTGSDDFGNLRLTLGSPCLDAADNDNVPADTNDLDNDGNTTEPIPFDLDGSPRFVDHPLIPDTGNGTPPIVDMGAYEYQQTIIRVDVDTPDNNDGSSWGKAYRFLQDALANANSAVKPVEIWVADGNYYPDGNTADPCGTGNREATFRLINGVAIYGGFAGGETSLDERDWQTNVTTLTGDIGTPGYIYDNSYHVVTSSLNDASAVLDGFIITYGYADGSGTDANGGGMYNDVNSTPTVSNCTFSFNHADNSGGGMYNKNAGPILNNCTFSENTAGGNGGGMSNNVATLPTPIPYPVLTGCSFSGNQAGDSGGGMYNLDTSPGLINCTFSENSAVVNGGGMSNNISALPTPLPYPELTGCSFTANTAGANGGGMSNVSALPTPLPYPALTGCSFSGNQAGDSGGGMYNLDTGPGLNNCTFSENSAVVNGGAMSNNVSVLPTPIPYPELTGCTFTANTAGANGGGMSNVAVLPTPIPYPVLTGCSFSGNQADNSGGGMYNQDTSPELITCTFSQNSAVVNGGGMSNVAVLPTPIPYPALTGCSFSGNQAGDSGGGMHNLDAGPILNNCTFSENSAVVNGGAMSNNISVLPTPIPYPELTGCTFTANTAGANGGGMSNVAVLPTPIPYPVLTGCSFSGNQADNSGGGMYNLDTSPGLINCTFSQNTAVVDGGGMNNVASVAEPTPTPALAGCTFTANTAGGNGGGMSNIAALPVPTPDPTLTGCILWGNLHHGTGGELAQIFDGTVVSHSCIEGLNIYAGNGNIGEDPCFVDPNGPDGIGGTEDDDLHLMPGSPCIDAGDNNSLPPDTTDLDGDGNTTEPIPWDADGRPRIMDGDCNDSNVVDIGSYEFAWVYLGDFDGQCDVDWVDYAIFAWAWLSEQGQGRYNADCDIALPADAVIDEKDLKILSENWLAAH
jgi:hypothetical protein